MNYYAFHIGDYAGATRHLSWDEDAAYRRLLDAYYVREAPIPAEPRQAYRLVQASTEQQREAVDVILSEFFDLRDDGWHNHRCDAEISAVREKSQKAQQSAQKRWGNATKQADALPSHAEPGANACAEPCEGNAPNPNPNPNKKHPSGAARATRLASDWEPSDEDRQFALSQGISGAAFQLEADKFSDYYRSIAGEKSRRLDWAATFRSWCRKAVEGYAARASPKTGEPQWAQDKRERMQQLAGPAAAKPRQTAEIIDVTTARLG